MRELLRINVERTEGATRVVLSGDLDMTTAQKLRSLLVDLERGGSGPPHLIVDLRELTFIDSTGLETVIRAEASCRREGTKLTLIKARPELHRVFVLTGFHRHVTFKDEPAR